MITAACALRSACYRKSLSEPVLLLVDLWYKQSKTEITVKISSVHVNFINLFIEKKVLYNLASGSPPPGVNSMY